MADNVRFRRADGVDSRSLQIWCERLEDSSPSGLSATVSSFSADLEDHVRPLFTAGPSASAYDSEDDTSEEDILALLNEDQQRAFDIIAWHVEQSLAGLRPPPLRMIIHGEGGTGKTLLLQAISQFFRDKRIENKMKKNAYTGIAASLIDGQTCHSAALMAHKLGASTKRKLERIWRDVEYNFTDEMSMIGKRFIARMSSQISLGKTGGESKSKSFGGISFIASGDFFQFPPVACSPNEALYWPSDKSNDAALSQAGRSIYKEFTTVVVLKHQMRVSDPEWLAFLRHLRHGEISNADLRLLRSLVLTRPNATIPNFDEEPWKDVMLVTPRHAVRQQWNDAFTLRLSKHTHQPILVSPIRYDARGHSISEEERLKILRCRHPSGQKHSTNELQVSVSLVVGARVFVTQNIDVSSDITNGTRGTIVKILLHPREPPLRLEVNVVRLSFPPSVVFIKLDQTGPRSSPGLDSRVVPIKPVARSFRTSLQTANGASISRLVYESQLPITPAYACTDYRAQGQTLSSVIVDISSPPTGSLSLFNLYVALSRSRGRANIRILRDFDDKLFKKGHNKFLLSENDRLRKLDELTEIWWKQLKAEEGRAH